jgi:hypothetical protein
MRTGAALLILPLLVLLPPRPARAQAWPAPAGSGSVTVSTQVIDNTGHRMSNGFLLPDGRSRNVSASIDLDYAFTGRWSISAGLPYVFARFLGPNPSPANLPVDSCRCWHGDWADVGASLRYAVLDGPVGLTASVGAGVPSHDYEWQGEAVAGYGLRELRVGLDGGARLGPISERLAVTGRYQYAAVQDVQAVPDVANNRSNWAAGLSLAVTPRLSVRAGVSGQRTHGGLRFGSITDPNLPPPGEAAGLDRFQQHDRLLRNNFVHLGGGVTYALAHVDVFLAYEQFVQGTDTHAGKAITTGVSVPFQR